LPLLVNGYVTFGCLNNFSKVSEPAARLWSRLLREIPHSRLILHSRQGSHRERIKALLVSEGVEDRRVSFVGVVPMQEYLRQYRQIDIALDPFPYAGGTTTCDALWMGVPMVTLRGHTAVGRGGVINL
jgi:predicted O-linked N-acetylglucosamine transferase (SPINDLY family)